VEKYTIDYVKVFKEVHVVSVPMGDFENLFSVLEEYNVETFIYSKYINRIVVIIHTNKQKGIAQSFADIKEELLKITSDAKWSEKTSLVEIGGLFIDGCDGLSVSVLEALSRSKINLQYQIMNPSQYSLLINKSEIRKCLKALSRHLGVRDSIISIS